MREGRNNRARWQKTADTRGRRKKVTGKEKEGSEDRKRRRQNKLRSPRESDGDKPGEGVKDLGCEGAEGIKDKQAERETSRSIYVISGSNCQQVPGPGSCC